MTYGIMRIIREWLGLAPDVGTGCAPARASRWRVAAELGPPGLPVDREKAVAVRKLVAAGLFPGKVAKQLGIGRSTVYRIVRQCGNPGTPMDVFTSSRPWVDAFTSMPCGPPVQGQNTAKCSGKGRETVKGRRGLGDVSAVPNIHNAHAADAGRIWLRQVETH